MQNMLNLQKIQYDVNRINEGLKPLYDVLRQTAKKDNYKAFNKDGSMIIYYTLPKDKIKETHMHMLELDVGDALEPSINSVGVIIRRFKNGKLNVKFYAKENKSMLNTAEKGSNLDGWDALNSIDEIDTGISQEKAETLYNIIKSLENDYYGAFDQFMVQALAYGHYMIKHEETVANGKVECPLDIEIETVDSAGRSTVNSYGTNRFTWHKLPETGLNDYSEIVAYKDNGNLRITNQDHVGELNKFVQSLIDNHINSLIDLKMFLQKYAISPKVIGDYVYKNTEESINETFKNNTPSEIIKFTKDLNHDPFQRYPYFTFDGKTAKEIAASDIKYEMLARMNDILPTYLRIALKDPEHELPNLMDHTINRNPEIDRY